MNTNTALRYSTIGLLFIIPFIPLVVASSLYFPYITGKAFWFRTIIEIAFLVYAILVVRDRSYLPKKSALLWSMAGFVGILGLATIFAENPYRSFWSNYERMEGYVSILHLLAYFVMLAGVFSRRVWFWFAHTTLAASVIIGLFGFADKQDRIAGTLGNSTYLGVYALLHLFIAGFFMFRVILRKSFTEALPWVSGYLILIVFNLFVLFRTGTRGSFVGLVVGGIVTAILLVIFEKNKTIRYASVTVLALVVIAVGALGLGRNTTFVKSSATLSRFSELVTFNLGGVLQNQGYARTVIWSIAGNGFKERPILGWGQDNFNYVFAKYYDPRMYSQEQWFDRSHNVFFDWLIAGGLLGLLGYLSLFVAAMYLIWRKQSEHAEEHWMFTEKAVLTGMFVAYFIHNLFVFDHLVSYLVFFALLAYVHHRSTARVHHIHHAQDGKPAVHHHPHHIHVPLVENIGAQSAIVAAVAIVVVVAMYTAVIKPYIAGTYLIQALQAHSGSVNSSGQRIGGNEEKSLEYFQKVFALNSFGSIEARERLSEVAADVVASPTANSKTKLAFAQLTQDQYSEQFRLLGADPRPSLFYGLYLAKLNQVDEAIKYVDKARELSPKKQSFLFQLGLLHFQKKEYAQAVVYTKEAYELDNTYQEALALYVATLVYNGQSADADMEIAAGQARGIDVSSDPRILQGYLDTKQFAKMVQIIKSLVAKDPQNPQLHVSLAAAYLKLNDRTDAIKEIEEAIRIEPAFKAQGDAFIKEIRAGRDPSAPPKTN